MVKKQTLEAKAVKRAAMVNHPILVNRDSVRMRWQSQSYQQWQKCSPRNSPSKQQGGEAFSLRLAVVDGCVGRLGISAGMWCCGSGEGGAGKC